MEKKTVKFMTILSPWIEDFIRFRKAEGEWSDMYYGQLRRFDEFCFKNHMEAWDSFQEILNLWAAQHSNETSNSCRSRQDLIISLTKFINKSSGSNYHISCRPHKSTHRRIPHHFSEIELSLFFAKCDHIAVTKNALDQKLRKITLPVYFRLLYSTGIRVNEARLLKKKDVDLKTGRLYVHKSKGSNEHIIVLEDSMLDLMVLFDQAADQLINNREYFFQSSKGTFYSSTWVRNNFSILWKSISRERAVPYDFRHQYATDNINCWINSGFDFLDKLLYLSKSMGHTSIESTKYYYSLVPALSETIKNVSEENLKDLLPVEKLSI